MNAKKILVLLMAVCIGLAVLPARSFAIGEAGTMYAQPEFGFYGVSQNRVSSVINFGASGGYFITDGLSIGAEALAYSFNQYRDGVYRSGFDYNPWAFGFNGLIRFYPVRTDSVAFFIGSGLGGLFSSERIPYYSNGGRGEYANLTLPVDIGFLVNMTQNVALEVTGRYQRIGFTGQGLDTWGGHAGIRFTF